MSPLVSVCILTFNSAAFIKEAVASAIKQSLQNIEIVIVDNGSADSTMEILRELQAQDLRISVHANETPLGISGGLNRCLELAHGEYIKILMHDDVLEPTCIERMVEAFIQHPTVSLVGCSTQLVDEKGKQLRILPVPYSKTGLVSGKDVMKQMLMKLDNVIGPPTSVLMRRSDYGDGFSRSIFFYLDVEMWLRTLAKGDYYFINEPLASLRMHSKTGTSISHKTLLAVADVIHLGEMYAEFMEQQGIASQQWQQIVNDRVLQFPGYILEEEKTSIEEVRTNARKLRALAGYDHADQLLEAMAEINFHALTRLYKSESELHRCENEVQRLSNEIKALHQTATWKLSKPLRELKARFLN